MSLKERRSGILLHPSSLPGRYGTGDLGHEAYRFLDQIHEAGQRFWQLLPLNPIGPCATPYSSSGSSACSDLLVSVEMLRDEGYLTDEEIAPLADLPDDRVDYGWLVHLKPGILDLAADRFLGEASKGEKAAYRKFCRRNADLWLDDYVLFATLQRHYDYAPWTTWKGGLTSRQTEAMATARDDHAEQIERLKVRQYFFDRQWQALRKYARKKKIQIVGDIPIFVAHDSADVWANQDMFKLDEAGNPSCVAGVPPDIFSEVGQRWGNPHYNWTAMEADGFKWWKRRLVRMRELADIIRIDHFLAFNAAWEIPAHEETAINGHWEPAPGYRLFQAFKDEFGEIPMIAEDLGVITDEVVALRKAFKIPGLNIMQFDVPDPCKYPYDYEEQSVTYTGTHDNNTTLGWFKNEGRNTLPDHEAHQQRERALMLMGGDGSDINWRMIGRTLQTPSRLVLLPMQDILDLGVEGRMNVPGAADGNWEWRYKAGEFSDERRVKLLKMTQETGRI